MSLREEQYHDLAYIPPNDYNKGSTTPLAYTRLCKQLLGPLRIPHRCFNRNISLMVSADERLVESESGPLGLSASGILDGCRKAYIVTHS